MMLSCSKHGCITVVIAALFISLQASALFVFGQSWICECGYVKLWEGVVLSAGNSQHLTDWYTFSHVIHGFLFYGVLWFFFPLARRSLAVPVRSLWRRWGIGGRMSIATMFLIALALEVGWEVVENTPWLIEHYRQQALAQGYVGDSILNSISDSLAMVAGFFLAWRLPVFATVALALGMELFVGFSIRDNLFLNILGFFHQFDFISRWQAGG